MMIPITPTMSAESRMPAQNETGPNHISSSHGTRVAAVNAPTM